MPIPASDPLLRESMSRLATRLRSRDVSAVELMEATLARVDQINPLLNSIVTLRRTEALAEAALADRSFAHGRQPRPLEGIPFTVKDLLVTAGVRTTAGSLILQDHVPTWTASAIQRLQDAGAILIGKSNCSEFGMGNLHTANRLFGDTWNPWEQTRTPGGSSGGDSSAVAAGLSVFGVGTDYGGSVRFPAHCTGVAALRPTPGRIPSTGVLPHTGATDNRTLNSASFQCWIQTIGPIARSAEDLTMLVQVMQGPDGFDSHTVPSADVLPADVDLHQLAYAWFDGDGTVEVRADVRSTVARAAGALRSRGLTVEALRPAGFERAAQACESLREAEGLPDHAALVNGRVQDLSTVVRDSLARAAATSVSLTEYRARARDADRVRSQILSFMNDWPILLLPVGGVPAFVPGPREFCAETAPAPRASIEACCRAISLLRVPAAVVACGTSVEGLPIGVQIVGRPFQDAQVLATARALEQEFGSWQPTSRP
jgi:Asp-tRNA(Asn)/Glu-tRNA(Gln) amidotransferase A subunit family amidase